MEETPFHIESEQMHVVRRGVEGERFEIWEGSSGHHALHAGRHFAEGEILIHFAPLVRIDTPTRHSVQVGETTHILLDPPFLQYINHGCVPNVAFDVRRMAVVAIRPIGKQEEILFFYPSTEWVMTHPFRCACRAPACLGEIRGAAFLPAQLPSWLPLSEHIQALRTRHAADGKPQ